jgi:hypothetical protein
MLIFTNKFGKKTFKQKNTLDIETRTENQSVWAPNLRYNQRVKPALIELLPQSPVKIKTSTLIMGHIF